MSIQQIRSYFEEKTSYEILKQSECAFGIKPVAPTQMTRVNVGYCASDRTIYLAAHYNITKRKGYYYAYNHCDEILAAIRQLRGWTSLCRVLHVNPGTWCGVWRTLPPNPPPQLQAYYKLRFGNPYDDGQLPDAFMDALIKLADILFAHF